MVSMRDPPRRSGAARHGSNTSPKSRLLEGVFGDCRLRLTRILDCFFTVFAGHR
jgi:hypothetical protein